jgi:putative ABC transport system substrate-binding protein
VYRIGYLSLSEAELTAENDAVFLQALAELGYVEGSNLVMEVRRADGRDERLPELAGELVKMNVDLIVATSAIAGLAVKPLTSTIPILLTSAGDPVAVGLVESLARPGGNITGLTISAGRATAKRIEILKSALPGMTHLAVLADPSQQTVDSAWQESREAAQTSNVRVDRFDARRVEELEPAFAAIVQSGCDGLSPQPSPFFTNQRARMVELATRYRLPAIYQFREFTRDGILLAYGPNIPAGYRRAATFVDRIFKGANPAEMPVEAPSVFDFSINLNTARALGITIPEAVLAQATEIIQ